MSSAIISEIEPILGPNHVVVDKTCALQGRRLSESLVTWQEWVGDGHGQVVLTMPLVLIKDKTDLSPLMCSHQHVSHFKGL